MAVCNIESPSETHLKLKSRKVSFVRNLLWIWSIVSKFCPKHGGDTVVLYAKCHNNWATETDVMDEQVFARVESKMIFEEYPIFRSPQVICRRSH